MSKENRSSSNQAEGNKTPNVVSNIAEGIFAVINNTVEEAGLSFSNPQDLEKINFALAIVKVRLAEQSKKLEQKD